MRDESGTRRRAAADKKENNMRPISHSPASFGYGSLTYLLSCRVPAVELDRSTVGVEGQRVDLNTKSRDVLLLELSRQVTFDECRLADSSISDEDQFELRCLLRLLVVVVVVVVVRAGTVAAVATIFNCQSCGEK